ncbi:ABC transporter permease/M1 family aminopeptidase [Spongiimicrobium salis]|uniref:ABC transporter permease/M1 family aminopeptidase n=1 Tax=Spongiimicrobium salis TaxID=1667022 RepID=UPI00374DE4EC
MLRLLLGFEALYQSKQRALPLLAIIFGFFGFFVGGVGQAPALVDFNSAYQISYYTSTFSLSSVFIIMFFSVSGVLRDSNYQMDVLIYSTSLKKGYFFWSRFIGIFLFSVLAFSLFLPGFLMGLSISDLDSSRIAPFEIKKYLWVFFVIIVPNIFICTSLIFSVSILSKNALATYSSAVLIYILYFLSAFYSNSPLLAASVPASPSQMTVAALADPFSITTFYEHTQFWTPADKNKNMLSFSGLYFWNRVLWTVFSFLLLAGTYRLFSYRKSLQKIKKKKLEAIVQPHVLAYFSVSAHIDLKTQWLSFWSSLWIDIKAIFKSLPFLVIVLILFSSSVMELYSRIFEGGSYGDSWYPYTNLLIEIVMELVPMLGLILIVFYSGELIWRARNYKFEGILNTTPALNWVFFLSKLVTLLLLPVFLIFTVILVCIAFQLTNGHFDLEIGQYLALFYYYGVPMYIAVMVAVFIQGILNNKYLGMGIAAFVLLFLSTPLASNLGIEHPMLRIGSFPRPIYSNMAGYSIHTQAFHSYTVYWFAFAALLSIVAFKVWKRGIIGSGYTIKSIHFKNWKQWEVVSLSVVVLLFLISGFLLYSELNVKQTYRNSNDRLNYSENYERNFKKYDTIPRLHYIDLKTEVALYPNTEKYAVFADYQLINKNNVPVTHLFLTERNTLAKVSVANATLILKDTVFGTYLFKFNTPILPKERARLRYNFVKQSSPFQIDRRIVKNGTYIRHEEFEPVLGYYRSYELFDSHERKKRGLPPKEVETLRDQHLFDPKVGYGNIWFETIVSTSGNQTALAPGNLQRQWTENGRNFFHYKFPEKNVPSLAYFSADYTLKKDKYHDISLEYYYENGHEMNHSTINNSTKNTLAYCIDQFGNYTLNHLRIAEIPSYHSFGGAAHPGLINMVEDNLYLIDIRATPTFDLVSKRTIHEVAHQWWGMILTPKNVEGAAFFVEGFAKYTESIVLEKMYGKGALWQLNKQSNNSYFSGRTFATAKEPPMYLEDGEYYLAYGKSSLILQSLRDLIGETKLNTVLKTLTQRHGMEDEYEVHTLEFMEELYKETPLEYHKLVDDWMKEVIRYDLAIGDTSYKQLANGNYELSIALQAKRFKQLNNGEEKEIPINEPIQIGLFKEHPKSLQTEDTPIYLKAHIINKAETLLKIEVETLPKMIAIDPFLTRIDRVFIDNIKEL